MNHPFTFIKSRAWLYFVHWSLWMFTVDEMRMKTAFTTFTLDESSAMHIQSAKCKFTLSTRKKHWFGIFTSYPTRTGRGQTHVTAFSAGTNTGRHTPLTKHILLKDTIRKNNTVTSSS